MARKPQSRGTCVFCHEEMSKAGISRHLKTCTKRLERNAQAVAKGAATQPLYHLQAQDAWGGDFWLHLEVKGTATLKQLDSYLRAIWLECCGHLSQFSIGGWSGDEIAKSRTIAQVFTPGVELTHIYDFGTSSHTLIKMMAVRDGVPLTRYAIYLMARNIMPEAICMECDKPAYWLCMECIYEQELTGFLCDEHVETHPHHNYGEPLPLVNSPRSGMCGYTGPADPPY